MTTITRVTSEPHALYARYVLWHNMKRIGEIDVDLSTIMNSRGYKFKEEFVGKTIEEVEAIVAKPIEWFKEQINKAGRGNG